MITRLVRALPIAALLAVSLTPPAFAEVILGTNRADVLVGTSEADKILAGRGDDVVRGRGGRDEVFAQDGDDRVYGGRGADVLFGQSGQNRVFGGPGPDTIWGYYFIWAVVKPDGPGRGIDVLHGGTGDDRISPSQDDTVYAGRGDDVVFVATGGVVVDCGPGTDKVRLDKRSLDVSTQACEKVVYSPRRSW